MSLSVGFSLSRFSRMRAATSTTANASVAGVSAGVAVLAANSVACFVAVAAGEGVDSGATVASAYSVVGAANASGAARVFPVRKRIIMQFESSWDGFICLLRMGTVRHARNCACAYQYTRRHAKTQNERTRRVSFVVKKRAESRAIAIRSQAKRSRPVGPTPCKRSVRVSLRRGRFRGGRRG